MYLTEYMRLYTYNMKIAVVYAYYEKNQTYVNNLLYFLENGIIQSEDIHYYIIVNGTCTIIPICQPNMTVIRRPNEGFDFGAFGSALEDMTKNNKSYTHYIFINTSCRGPFMPTYVSSRWTDAFTDMLKGNVKLVGPTINLCPKENTLRPHVQSYCFAIDHECKEFLTNNGVFSASFQSIYDVIDYQELRMSSLVLDNGWNINCFVSEYRDRDYKNVINFNRRANSQFGDILFPGKLCFGRNVHPYEVMFIKTERDLAVDEWQTLTEAAKHKRA